MDALATLTTISGAVFLVLAFMLLRLEKEEQDETYKTKQFSYLRSRANHLHQEIQKLKKLHPHIEEISVIEGENTHHYMDQGVIRDKTREYFFPIVTPLREDVNGDGLTFNSLSHNTFIKVAGVMSDYDITMTTTYGKKGQKVVFNSLTGKYVETFLEPQRKI